MELWLERLLCWWRRGRRALRQRRRHSLQRCVRVICFGLVVTMLVVTMLVLAVVVVTLKVKLLPLTMTMEGAFGNE